MREDVANLMISEKDFDEVMSTRIEPWINKEFTKRSISSYDGTKLACYYNVNPDEKAAVAFCHGMGEFFPKYYELAYVFYNMGYSVFFIEHRGFGFSQRAVERLDHIYVESYSEYVDDYKEFMDKVVTQYSKSHKYVLFAHSMGGGIGTLFLEKYPQYFQTAILSSPMHRMNLGQFKPWQVSLLGGLMKMFGQGDKIVPGQREFDGINVWEKSSSMSKARYDFQFNKRLAVPEYTTYGGTYAWSAASVKATKKLLKNAADVKIPVLVCQAGLDTLVDNEGHSIFKEATDNTTLKVFSDSKHEIFNATDEIREQYFETVFDYLDKTLR
ncbi:MAG: alpha/beta hydrolase [Lachnospiraceae bacterium]|nr:alpha/beta hydrolase [Lachnospiraceae bacterium]